MDIEVGRDVGLDVLEKLPELLAAVAPVALSDELSGRGVEGGEQRALRL